MKNEKVLGVRVSVDGAELALDNVANTHWRLQVGDEFYLMENRGDYPRSIEVKKFIDQIEKGIIKPIQFDWKKRITELQELIDNSIEFIQTVTSSDKDRSTIIEFTLETNLIIKNANTEISYLKNRYQSKNFFQENFQTNLNLPDDFIIRCVSRFFPFTSEEIRSLDRIIDWGILSLNTSVKWDASLIEKYADKLNWTYLSWNIALPWNEKGFIQKHKLRWDWEQLCRSSGTYLSENVLKECSEFIESQHLEMGGNIDWTVEKIKHNHEKNNWSGLSTNRYLPWSIELIDTFIDHWDWHWLSFNKNLPWSVGLIDKYSEMWDWMTLSKHLPIPITDELIMRYEDYWDWSSLSENPSLSVSEEFFEKNYKKFSKFSISANPGLPWSRKFIDKFFDLWVWKGYFSLSNNPGINWDSQYLQDFDDKLDWKFLSSNEGIDFTEALYQEYEDKWILERLEKNKSFFTNVLQKSFQPSQK